MKSVLSIFVTNFIPYFLHNFIGLKLLSFNLVVLTPHAISNKMKYNKTVSALLTTFPLDKNTEKSHVL